MTPPPPIRPNYIENSVFTTPKRSQDLYRDSQQLARVEKLSRSTRALIAKAGKALSRANTRAAELQASNIRLQAQLNLLKINVPKKQVRPCPNKRFADIEAIKRAVDKAATKAAKKPTKRRTK
jgi:hypothetical protein